jgi:uncharacterized protein YacL (UPF0231 family)
MYPMKKTIIPPIVCLTSFFDKDNSVIILLQFMVIWVWINNEKNTDLFQLKKVKHFIKEIKTKTKNKKNKDQTSN